jgi:hypothetical protein
MHERRRTVAVAINIESQQSAGRKTAAARIEAVSCQEPHRSVLAAPNQAAELALSGPSGGQIPVRSARRSFGVKRAPCRAVHARCPRVYRDLLPALGAVWRRCRRAKIASRGSSGRQSLSSWAGWALVLWMGPDSPPRIASP